MKKELIALFVKQVLSKFGHIGYPPSTYDSTFDEMLSKVFYKFCENNNIDIHKKNIQEVVDQVALRNDPTAKGTEIYLNCWQMIILINLFADPMSLARYTEISAVKNIAENLASQQFQEDAQIAILESNLKSAHPKAITNLNDIPFGTTIYLFGRSHVCMYTENGKVLSQWKTPKNEPSTIKDKIDGFKEVSIEDLLAYITSSPSLLRDAIDRLHSIGACVNEQQEELINMLEMALDNEIENPNLDYYMNVIQPIILNKLKEHDIPYIHYALPIMNVHNLEKQLNSELEVKPDSANNVNMMSSRNQ